MNESGQTVLLQGANIIRYNWKWPDAQAMRQDFAVARSFTKPIEAGGWGANSFTIWVQSNPVNAKDSEYMQWMDGMVAIARENGAYIILAWHKDRPEGVHPRHITEAGIKAMASLARRYKNVPNVIYATQAEPGNGGRDGSQLSWTALKPYQERTIDAIRQEHPRALIGVAGTLWSQRVEGMLRDPILRDNIFVKPHIYASMPGVITKRKIDEVAERWPVIIGEFGTGGRMSNADSRAVIRYANEHLSGWQAWNLSDIGRPVMLTSHRDMTPTSFGQAVKSELTRYKSSIAAAPVEITLPFRINVGGPALMDDAGYLWMADRKYIPGAGWGYVDGAVSSGWAARSVPASDGMAMLAAPHPVLSTERWGMQGYRVRLPNGVYDLRLHFAETYEEITQVGQRVFDVTVQGGTVISGLDVFAEAGFGSGRVKEIIGVEVGDGVLEVGFTGQEEYPILNGIEVLPNAQLSISPGPRWGGVED